MTCKDCIHCNVCAINGIDVENTTFKKELCCREFKDKSRIIELPCKAGDTLYTIHKFKYDEDRFYYILEENPSIPIRGVYELACDFDTGSCVFYSTDKLEAEAKLKELNEK